MMMYLPRIPAMEAIVTMWPWFRFSIDGKKDFRVCKEKIVNLCLVVVIRRTISHVCYRDVPIRISDEQPHPITYHKH